MGRPKGSKNQPGHKAGGNQISQKAKKKSQEKQQKDTERPSQTDVFWERAHANKKKQEAIQQAQQQQQQHGAGVLNPQQQVQQQEAAQQQQEAAQQQQQAAQKKQAERLRHVFNHPSNKYGVPGYVDSIERVHTTSSEGSEADDKKFRPSHITQAAKWFTNLSLPE
jgi:hypothetical protein